MADEAVSTRRSGDPRVRLALAYSLPLVAGASAGAAFAYLLVRPAWGDQTWLMFAAKRILEMGRFSFEDLVEANPPLIVWLSLLLQAALQGCLAALAVMSIAWSCPC
jgi:hypothetical protein